MGKDTPINRGGLYARYFGKSEPSVTPVTKLRETVTKLESVTKVGRPKRHATAADRAKAYRERRKANGKADD